MAFIACILGVSEPAVSQIAMCYDETTGAIGLCPAQEGSSSGSYGGGFTIEGDPSPLVSGRDQFGRNLTEALEDIFRGSSRETERRRQEFERDWEHAVQAIQRQRKLSIEIIERAEIKLLEIQIAHANSAMRNLDGKVNASIREAKEDLSLDFDYDPFHFAPFDNWYLLDLKTPILSPSYVNLRETVMELFRARTAAFHAWPNAFEFPDYSSEEDAALPEWAAYSLAEHFLRVADALFSEGRQIEGEEYLDAGKTAIENAKIAFPLRSVSKDYGFYRLIDLDLTPAPTAWASSDRYRVKSAEMTQNTSRMADQVFGKFAELGGDGTFTVTSAYRSPEEQAAAMLGIIAAGGNFSAYKDLGPPIKEAFDIALREEEGRRGGPVPLRYFRDDAIDAMVSVIEGQIQNGRFLSYHMLNNAIDISTTGMSATKQDLVLMAARSLGLKAEPHANPPHIHISCNNIGVDGMCEFENELEISPRGSIDARSHLDGPSVIRKEYRDLLFYELPIVTNCPTVKIGGERFRSIFFLTGFGSDAAIMSDTGATQTLFDQVLDGQYLKVRPFQLLVKEELLDEFRSRVGASWLGLAIGNSLYSRSPKISLICNATD